MAIIQESLKVGDIVTLKSGGPEMTVSALGLPGTVIAVWFDGNEQLCSDEFNEHCLDKIN